MVGGTFVEQRSIGTILRCMSMLIFVLELLARACILLQYRLVAVLSFKGLPGVHHIAVDLLNAGLY